MVRALQFSIVATARLCVAAAVLARPEPSPCRAEEVPAKNAAAAEPRLELVLLVTETREFNGVKLQQQTAIRRVESDEADAIASLWVFGNQSQPVSRESLEAVLDEKIEALGQRVELNAEMRRRLKQAGRLDIARFWGEYEDLSLSLASCDRNKASLTALARRGETLQTRFGHGLHWSKSLYEKTLRTVLTWDDFAEVVVREPAARGGRDISPNRLAVIDQVQGVRFIRSLK